MFSKYNAAVRTELERHLDDVGKQGGGILCRAVGAFYGRWLLGAWARFYPESRQSLPVVETAVYFFSEYASGFHQLQTSPRGDTPLFCRVMCALFPQETNKVLESWTRHAFFLQQMHSQG